MILTDREILVALQQGLIVVDPSPDPIAFSSTSLDLTLAADLKIWKQESAGSMDVTPAATDYSYAAIVGSQAQDIAMTESGHVMKPRDFILAWTNEAIGLPVNSCIAARVEGKSSLARIGIGVHITAPTIHSGFGPKRIQLEIFNLGPLKVKLEPGMRVCQLIFEQTYGTPEKGYVGQFS